MWSEPKPSAPTSKIRPNELAKRARVTPSTVYSMFDENRQEVTVNLVEKLCSKKDFRLVELILDIARNLQVPVIAEGVETEAQLLMLKDAGCALVQGFYFSRSLPPGEFENKIFMT